MTKWSETCKRNEALADDADFSYLFQRMYFFLCLKLGGFGFISRAQQVRGSP